MLWYGKMRMNSMKTRYFINIVYCLLGGNLRDLRWKGWKKSSGEKIGTEIRVQENLLDEIVIFICWKVLGCVWKLYFRIFFLFLRTKKHKNMFRYQLFQNRFLRIVMKIECFLRTDFSCFHLFSRYWFEK